MQIQLRIFKVEKQKRIDLRKQTLFFFFKVMLQPQTAGQPDDRSKHKFMVQWASVPSSYAEDVDNFVC